MIALLILGLILLSLHSIAMHKANRLSPEQKILARCRRLSERERIIASHTFNTWKWPVSLQDLRPDWWKDSDMGSDEKFNYLRQFKDELDASVDPKAAQHYHIVEYLDKTEEYFEEHWKTSLNNPNRVAHPNDDMMLRVLMGAFKDKYEATGQEIKNVYMNEQMKDKGLLN